MTRNRLQATVLSVAAVLPLVLTAAACSRSPEQQLLAQFFRAARARDNTTLAMMSAVEFSPREQGTVNDFSITNVGQETRTPIGLKALIEADRAAKAAEADFAKRKMEYQTANLAIIQQVVKLERDPAAKMTPAQQAVKTAWDKWRADSSTFTRGVSDARAALARATGPAVSSLSQPGQPDFDPATFEGELVTKDVAVAATVTSPTGEAAAKDLTITLMRVVGTVGGQPREGRWIISKIAGV
jgi:hypothetical protein